MHIIIAPNAFKNSLNARDAACAIEEGLKQSKLSCSTEIFPIGDGGDGTAELIIEMCNGAFVNTIVSDPLGRPLNTAFGLIEEGNTAVIEMANASGLRILKREELNPLKALSFGTGEQMKVALDKGVKKIIVAMGGSATVDGGIGILMALGIRFLNKNGKELKNLPEELFYLEEIDLSGMDYRINNCEIVVLCDVDNNLLGDNGAAAVFGPQKGASMKEVTILDKALAKLSEVAFRITGKSMKDVSYSGTAGGAAAALYAFLNAKMVRGIEYFLDITNFNTSLSKASLVITGEGSIDDQTLQGKGPFGVATRAKEYGIPVIGLAGRLPLQKSKKLQERFDILLSIGNEPTSLTSALNKTKDNLKRIGQEVGDLLAIRI